MDNKKVLSQLIKIASNQQAILNKLAQAYDSSGDTRASAAALSDFIKYQFTSWAMPKEVAGKISHTVESTGAKSYNADIVVGLTNPAQKSLVEDPVNGFAAWLNKKFATAPSVEKWKALAGCTVNFNVTTN